MPAASGYDRVITSVQETTEVFALAEDVYFDDVKVAAATLRIVAAEAQPAAFVYQLTDETMTTDRLEQHGTLYVGTDPVADGVLEAWPDPSGEHANAFTLSWRAAVDGGLTVACDWQAV